MSLANSFIATGSAKAFESGMSPERWAERSAAYANKEASDQKLKALQETRPTDQDFETMRKTQTAELQNALETQKQMMRDNNKRTVFNAYERFDGDGDIKHINTMIDDLRASGSNMYGKIARVDKITENDRQALISQGIPDNLVDLIINDSGINKSFVMYTQTDGSKEFGSIDDLKALQGYNSYATEAEIKRQERTILLGQLSTLGYKPDDNTLEAVRRAKAEMPNADLSSPEFQQLVTTKMQEIAKEKRAARGSAVYNEVGTTGKLSEAQNEAVRRARLELDMEANPGDPVWDEAVSRHLSNIKREWKITSADKNLEQVEAVEDELLDMGLLDMEPSDMQELSATDRMQIERRVRRIEEQGGAKLGAAESKMLRDIRKLTAMGDLAGDLTDAQTGIIDSVLRTAKKYISDNVEGVEATSAYSAFRNLVKHALYGASLQPGESANFTKQFGSLAQQRGPILVQLRTTMEELRTAYEAIAEQNNDMVIKWRTGMTGEDLYDVLEAIDERIEFIDNVQKGLPVSTVNPPVQTEQKTELTDDKRAKLRAIYNPDGANQ
jgi:hypothetical protein